MITLERLNLHRAYGKDGLVGTAEFKGSQGEVNLRLDEEAAQIIVAACAEALVETTRRTAEQLSAAMVEHLQQPSLEAALEALGEDDDS